MKLEVSERCVGCGRCVKDCPVGALKLENGKAVPRKPDQCIGCLHCVAVCPFGALTMNDVSAADCAPLAKVPSAEEVKSLIKQRRSIRQYQPTELPPEVIDDLLSTLNYAPTGCNARATKFLVVSDLKAVKTKLVEFLKAHFNSLPDFLKGPTIACIKKPEADPFFRGAPHLLIVQALEQAVTPIEDCVAACAYFDILVQGCGYGSTWCGFLKMIVDAVPETAAIFGLEANRPFYAMLFGRPAVAYARVCLRN